MKKAIQRLICCALLPLLLQAWGVRGHMAANRAAMEALPADGPIFLRKYIDWIGATGPVPDSWRGTSEPYSKIFEDPNHGWFKEQFAFLPTIPRSRYEFVLRLYDRYNQIKNTDSEGAKLTNVRWTGTLPYAAMENFDRIKSSMRLYRKLDSSQEAQRENLERDIAFYVGWLGHYTADGAQPLHDTIQHDGWQGPNPHSYTTDHTIHGRFESAYVDLLGITDTDLTPNMTGAKHVDDPFARIIDHLDDAASQMELIYQLDQQHAFADKNNRQASTLVKMQLAKAASLLRDLVYTAWLDSARPIVKLDDHQNPISHNNPNYQGETGSAPPLGPPVPNRPLGSIPRS